MARRHPHPRAPRPRRPGKDAFLNAPLLRTRRLALAGMFAGLAWGAGYVDAIPNFEFLTVILFAGGFVLGPLGGACAGALGEFLYSTINPYGSGLAVPLVLAAQVAGMALAGAVGGWLGQARGLAAAPRPVRAAAIVVAGVVVTLVFDLLTNLASAVMFGPIVPTLVAAVPFSLVHVGTNAALFAAVGVALTGALERTRRSLVGGAVLLLAGAALAGLVGAGQAQAEESVLRRAAPAPDSTYRDRARRPPPPAWGDGPATLSRRSDGAAARWLTREGGMTERFADERGSAEPLSRLGLPGARLELDWLGLPAAAPGAVGGASTRVPWHAVGAVEAPRLPTSARVAFRGEAGETRFLPYAAEPGHPRVTVWSGMGSHEHTRTGFLATGTSGASLGLIAVESAGFGRLAPLGPEGDHAVSGAVRHDGARLALEAAYRSARETVEDDAGTPDTRAGEAGRIAARLVAGATTWTLGAERTDERVAGGDFFAGDSLAQLGKTARVRLEAARDVARGRGWLAATWGRETLESEGAVAFGRRVAHLAWGAAGWNGPLAGGARVELALGAGAYGGEAATIAPSVLVERPLAAGTRAWAGAARGLGARLDPRARDALGAPVAGDPPVLASSTWLGGVGLERRSAMEEAGGDARGAWPRGSHRARVAFYAGRSTPGFDPPREPFATDAVRALTDATFLRGTRFVAVVGDGAIAPLQGLRLEVGGHVLGRTVDEALVASDPEWRVAAEIEARDAFLEGDLDLRVGALGEAIGPRRGTPVGDLPAATRLGVFAGFSLDDFHLRAELRDLAGTHRELPVLDRDGVRPLRADRARFGLEARWTFWD